MDLITGNAANKGLTKELIMIFKRYYFWISSFTIIVAFLIFSTSCKKDYDDEYSLESGTVTDIDGNVYQTVIIGTQQWMAGNLKTTRYNDGTSIEYPGTENIAWENITKGAYTWYNNDKDTYRDTYGALYNWYAVNTGKLCPAGWRVPEDDEWTEVNKYLVNNAGGKLKENSSEHWSEINAGATNETGFNAVPGGVRFSSLPGGSGVKSSGYFFYIGKNGRWWASTAHSSENAWYRTIHFNSGNIYRSHNIKKTGLSVRCVRN